LFGVIALEAMRAKGVEELEQEAKNNLEKQLMSRHIGIVTTCTPFSYVR
jgi:hypothetical protein